MLLRGPSKRISEEIDYLAFCALVLKNPCHQPAAKAGEIVTFQGSKVFLVISGICGVNLTREIRKIPEISRNTFEVGSFEIRAASGAG